MSIRTRWNGLRSRHDFTPLRLTLLLCTVMLAACNAHVKDFTVQPRHICAGEPVQVEWNVEGSARITVSPPSDRLADGPVDEKGHALIAPTVDTRVELHVTRPLGNPTGAVQEIEVVGVSQREILAASLGDASTNPSCKDGTVQATVHAKRFSPTVKVATVMTHPNDSRTYGVYHEGRTATLVPGQPMSVFHGTMLAGDWILSAPVEDGQTCETVPPVLVIAVNTACLVEEHP